MGNIYGGVGLGREIVGSVEGNQVCRGIGLGREVVGSVEGNTVYGGVGLGREIVGSVEGNQIYRGFGLGCELAGSIEEHMVYCGFGLGREIVGNCSTVEEAAALLLLLVPGVSGATVGAPDLFGSGINADVHQGKQSDEVDLGAAVLLIIAKIFAVVVLVGGAILIWPLIFSEEMQAENGALLYTAITIGASAVGLLIAVWWGSRKRLVRFLGLAAISGGVLMDIVLFYIDRANWTIPIALFMVPLFVFFTCGIPGVIIWMVFKFTGRLKK